MAAVERFVAWANGTTGGDAPELAGVVDWSSGPRGPSAGFATPVPGGGVRLEPGTYIVTARLMSQVNYNGGGRSVPTTGDYGHQLFVTEESYGLQSGAPEPQDDQKRIVAASAHTVVIPADAIIDASSDETIAGTLILPVPPPSLGGGAGEPAPTGPVDCLFARSWARSNPAFRSGYDGFSWGDRGGPFDDPELTIVRLDAGSAGSVLTLGDAQRGAMRYAPRR